MGVGETLVEILKNSPDHKLDFVILSNELARRRALGFGVDTKDIARELDRAGTVKYDEENDIVCLLDSTAYQELPVQKYRVSYTLCHIVEVEARSPGEARLLSYKKANLQSVYKLLPNRTEVIKVEAE